MQERLQALKGKLHIEIKAGDDNLPDIKANDKVNQITTTCDNVVKDTLKGSLSLSPTSTISNPASNTKIASTTATVDATSSSGAPTDNAEMRLRPVQRLPEKRKSGILKKERTFECRKALASRAGSADSPVPSSHDHSPLSSPHCPSPSEPSSHGASPIPNETLPNILNPNDPIVSTAKKSTQELSKDDSFNSSNLPETASSPTDIRTPSVPTPSSTGSNTTNPELSTSLKQKEITQVQQKKSQPSPSPTNEDSNKSQGTTSSRTPVINKATPTHSQSSTGGVKSIPKNAQTIIANTSPNRSTTTTSITSTTNTSTTTANQIPIIHKVTQSDPAKPQEKSTYVNAPNTSSALTAKQISKEIASKYIVKAANPSQNQLKESISQESSQTPKQTIDTTPTKTPTSLVTTTTPITKTTPVNNTTPSSMTTSGSSATSSTTTTTKSKVNKTLSMMGSTFNKIKSRAFGRSSGDKDSTSKNQMSDQKTASKVVEKIAVKNDKVAERMAAKTNETVDRRKTMKNTENLEKEVWTKQVGRTLDHNEQVALVMSCLSLKLK